MHLILYPILLLKILFAAPLLGPKTNPKFYFQFSLWMMISPIFIVFSQFLFFLFKESLSILRVEYPRWWVFSTLISGFVLSSCDLYLFQYLASQICMINRFIDLDCTGLKSFLVVQRRVDKSGAYVIHYFSILLDRLSLQKDCIFQRYELEMCHN